MLKNKCKKLFQAENIALTELLEVLNLLGYTTSFLAIQKGIIRNFGN